MIPCSKSRNLASGYQKIPIILGVNFEVMDGEFVGILGHNGMGKTTLAQDRGRPAAGDGRQHPLRRRRRSRARRRIAAPASAWATCRRAGRSFPALSVLDNMRMGAASAGLGDDVLDDVHRGASAAEADPGPRRRRAVRRRAADPRPGALPVRASQAHPARRADRGHPAVDHRRDHRDPAGLEERSGLTIVLVEQNLEFIRRLSDRVLIIQKGRITGEVPPDHLHDDALVAEFVGMSAH